MARQLTFAIYCHSQISSIMTRPFLQEYLTRILEKQYVYVFAFQKTNGKKATPTFSVIAKMTEITPMVGDAASSKFGCSIALGESLKL